MSSIAILAKKAATGRDPIDTVAEAIGAVRLAAWSQNESGRSFDVLVVSPHDLAAIPSPLEPAPKRLILYGTDVVDPMAIVSRYSIFAWVNRLHSTSGDVDPDFEKQVILASDAVREHRQLSESLALYQEHNEALSKLSQRLEARIETRRQELQESAWRLQQNQRRSEIMHRALSAVSMSGSIPEIERQLVHILHPQSHAATDAPNVEWVRIAYGSQSRLETTTPLDSRAGSVFSHPIGAGAHIHFGRGPDRPFRSDDRSFLVPIAESVALTVTRLQSLERMEQIKREWEETFNAILDPVAVLDERLRLVRANRALLKGRAPETVVGRACYEAVFGRSQPCPSCPVYEELVSGKHGHRGLNPQRMSANQFRIQSARDGSAGSGTGSGETLLEVTSRPIRARAPEGPDAKAETETTLLVHLYRDITTSIHYEKRILESAKMAELGTIGSSIAHQLNNPIGGMLSHIQLLLMDVDAPGVLNFEGKDELRRELKEMEAGTRRCAEIVRDLLGFSRRGIDETPQNHDLVEIVEQAVKITELQTRSHGVRFKVNAPAEQEIMVRGQFNLLAQAVRAVLLAILPPSLRDRTIELTVARDAGLVKVSIALDGFDVLESALQHENLDLTVAEQILAEHQGHLELQVQQAILSLPTA